MLVTLAGMVIEVRPDLAKAEPPIEVTVEGISNEVKEAQFLNTSFPKLVIVSGRVTEVSLRAPEKVASGNTVPATLVRSADCNKVALLKTLFPIWLTLGKTIVVTGHLANAKFARMTGASALNTIVMGVAEAFAKAHPLISLR